ncbi:hypothetical protein GGP41_007481 [Bipolaris sorokiniana]|uniref:Uncharacterized protein n=1 Tax=Cochliobolus sativus TaxID=45130 RepID=A0A8H5ZA51_COCSA|nr:hypothetical protein GGP41_007481 [Bipolaris sorokiniana]
MSINVCARLPRSKSDATRVNLALAQGRAAKPLWLSEPRSHLARRQDESQMEEEARSTSQAQEKKDEGSFQINYSPLDLSCPSPQF